MSRRWIVLLASLIFCNYLMEPDGTYAIGMSRPVVDLTTSSAHVTLYISGGGVTFAQNYSLAAKPGGLYEDAANHISLQLQHGIRASLTVQDLTTTCRRDIP